MRRAALGRAGVRALKREGDGGTPLGRFPDPPRAVPRRSRRASARAVAGPRDPAPTTAGAKIRLTATTIVSSNSRREATPTGLTRDDHLYDLVLVLGHNDRPRVSGRGSAIFVHLAREGLTPTAGCIALFAGIYMRFSPSFGQLRDLGPALNSPVCAGRPGIFRRLKESHEYMRYSVGRLPIGATDAASVEIERP